jgi:hypothetical protein
MKAHVRHIGVIEAGGKVHFVSFLPGVNVVTGRSSSGKSALIEIFDYCLGSSEFTVPIGVITEVAEIYFVVLVVQEANLVLGRRRDSKQIFLRESSDWEALREPSLAKLSYFDDAYFLSLKDFKVELGQYFGISVTDVAEVEPGSRPERSVDRNPPGPSVRSLTSFIFQHQNLIANKHAMFYRFDEREKRDQVIEHFKIFAGFVDQQYFILSRDLLEAKSELKRVEFSLPSMERSADKEKEKLQQGVLQFEAATGLKAGDSLSIDSMIRNPAGSLDRLRSIKPTVDQTSDEHAVKIRVYEEQKESKIPELRRKQRSLLEVRASIRLASEYIAGVENITLVRQAEIAASKCPFCGNSHTAVEDEANKLSEAVRWLNDELGRSPYLKKSLESEERRISGEVEALKDEIDNLDSRIHEIESQVAALENNRNLLELAIREKVRIETVLEEILEAKNQKGSAEDKVEKLKVKISRLNAELRDKYALEKKMASAEDEINELMAAIGSKFDFEESYRPIRLRFSLKTFDLWHDGKDGRKVFLRSMGSGANWLYSHIALFLALHRFFCRLGRKCSVPSIIFLDQPSQVYFPSLLDSAESFLPEQLAALGGGQRRRPVDEDLAAVTELYSELVHYCKETLIETGIEPQIIVTDHADNLKISGGLSFEELVAGRRWRSKAKGFIGSQD